MQSPASNQWLDGYFTVESLDKSFRQAMPRRIPFIRPFKDIALDKVEWMKENVYNEFGLNEYIPCWTGEMRSRPIPFVSTDLKPLVTQTMFRKYLPAVFNYLVPLITPGIQAINKVSALGYPISCNPGDGIDHRFNSATYGKQIHPSKFDIVLEMFESLTRREYETFRHGYHTEGVRKQNESPTRVRIMQFIDPAGRPYQAEVNAQVREIRVPGVGTMIGSRTRTIVRPPVINLYTQCWDTLLHNALKKHALFDANVYSTREWPADQVYRTYDCRHFERYLGLCAITYAELVGGDYETLMNWMIYYPFAVVSDNWKRFFMVKPIYTKSRFPQFSSGLSPVAPLGKLVTLCAHVAYFHEVEHYDIKSAVFTALSGTSESLRRWSFGDDNRITGSKVKMDEFSKFQEQYFDLEYDEVPKYLGTIYRPDLRRWCLPLKTYILKEYQPERDYDWKDYPNLGMMERRQTFTEYGEPEISAKVIPLEDELWTAIGHPYTRILTSAMSEKRAADQKGVLLSAPIVTDKAYLLTEQEQVQAGMAWHLTAPVTASIVIRLVGRSIYNQLTFRNMQLVGVPEPQMRLAERPLGHEKSNEIDESEEAEYAV